MLHLLNSWGLTWQMLLHINMCAHVELFFHIMFQRLLPTNTFPWKPSPRLNLKVQEVSSGVEIEKKTWGERQVQERPFCLYALHAFLREPSSMARCGHAPPTMKMKIHYYVYHPDLIVIISEWVHTNCSALLLQSIWN